MAGKPRTLARLVEFGYPIEMMGNKATVQANSRKAEIHVYDWGVKIISKTSGKQYRVYNSNIKAVELIPAAPGADEE